MQTSSGESSNELLNNSAENEIYLDGSPLSMSLILYQI